MFTFSMLHMHLNHANFNSFTHSLSHTHTHTHTHVPAHSTPGSRTLFGRGVSLSHGVGNLEWVATLFLTLLYVVATITLLALLHNLVPTEGAVVLREAVCSPLLRDGIQHEWDVPHGARRELVIVKPVSTGGWGEHDVVPLETSRLAGVWEVVWRAKVVPDFMCQGELRHLGRHPGVVVEEGDDAGVEGTFLWVSEAPKVLCVGLVLFTDSSRGPWKGRVS